MKKFFIIASVAMLSACNSQEPVKTDTMTSTADPTMKEITSPYVLGYSSKFVIDEPNNAETVMTLWKDWDNGDLSAHKDLFADSVEMHFADGSMMHASRDSVVAAAQGFRNTFTSATSSVNAVMAAKSTDKDENWAIIWGKEVNTDKNGKVDSFYLQETWRFNKDGKANLFYQFKAAGSPPKK